MSRRLHQQQLFGVCLLGPVRVGCHVDSFRWIVNCRSVCVLLDKRGREARGEGGQVKYAARDESTGRTARALPCLIAALPPTASKTSGHLDAAKVSQSLHG